MDSPEFEPDRPAGRPRLYPVPTVLGRQHFYQRVSIASYANRWYSQRRNVRLSLRPSVRPSHSGIVSKRRKLAS